MILDGKKLSDQILSNIKIEIEEKNILIIFAIIWVGDDESSKIYVNNKIKKCEEVGINVKLYHFDINATENELLLLIEKLNNDKNINGILLQSPLPTGININKCFNKINEFKDVDGLSYKSLGKLIINEELFISATPLGIMELFNYYNISLRGKSIVIINDSIIVGKPLFHLLINEGSTVTMCHKETQDINSYTKTADIIISAVGKKNFITSDMIKEGSIIIDVGITRENGKIYGDVDFDNVQKKCVYITPVPGGVGPMTIAMVIKNLLKTVKGE